MITMKFRKIMIVSAVMLLLAGCTKTETADTASKTASASVETTPVTTSEKPEINASDLWKKYDADPDKDTPTYDGAKETVTGVITYIGKDDHGTDSMEIADEKDGTSYVIGVFGSKEEMNPVSVGDTVTISGNFHIMSSTNKVVLKQCQIEKIYK